MTIIQGITERDVVVEGLAKSYDALFELDPGNDLLKYINWNGDGFSYYPDSDVRREFIERFSLPFDRSDFGRLVRYSNSLNTEVGRMSSL